MLSIRGLAKPQYFWRPGQLLRRIGHEIRPLQAQETIRLPWGVPIDVDTTDMIGAAIAQQGLYDVVTTELLWRLAGEGETALDVGANIGYFTALLACRTGKTGRVYSWEPHPKTFQSLKKNAARWSESPDLADITLAETALSNYAGTANLALREGEETNIGSSYLSGNSGEKTVPVRTDVLANFLASCSSVGVMKLDVEMHEAQVLEGAGKYLAAGSIRDIVFEEHGEFPSTSHKILLSAGYTLFWFEEHLRGLKLMPPDSQPRRREYDLPPSFLATRDPQRAQRLFSTGGWKSF